MDFPLWEPVLPSEVFSQFFTFLQFSLIELDSALLGSTGVCVFNLQWYVAMASEATVPAWSLVSVSMKSLGPAQPGQLVSAEMKAMHQFFPEANGRKSRPHVLQILELVLNQQLDKGWRFLFHLQETKW